MGKQNINEMEMKNTALRGLNEVLNTREHVCSLGVKHEATWALRQPSLAQIELLSSQGQVVDTSKEVAQLQLK